MPPPLSPTCQLMQVAHTHACPPFARPPHTRRRQRRSGARVVARAAQGPKRASWYENDTSLWQPTNATNLCRFSCRDSQLNPLVATCKLQLASYSHWHEADGASTGRGCPPAPTRQFSLCFGAFSGCNFPSPASSRLCLRPHEGVSPHVHLNRGAAPCPCSVHRRTCFSGSWRMRAAGQWASPPPPHTHTHTRTSPSPLFGGPLIFAGELCP